MIRLLKRAVAVFSHFFRANPVRSVVMVLLMASAGLAEGIGVLSLVPVLELAEGSGSAQSGLGRVVTQIVRGLNLDPTLTVFLALICAAITLKAVFLFLAQRQIGHTIAGVIRDLRLQLIRNLFGVRWSYFADRTPGELAASITSEAMRSGVAYQEACLFLAVVFQMAAYAIVAALVSWWIALGGFFVAIVSTILAQRYFKETRDAGKQQTKAAKNLSSRLIDVLQGIKAIKVMGREAFVWPLLEHETESLNQAKRREVTSAAIVKSFQEPILTFVLAFGLFFLLEVSQQDLSSTLIMAFLFYRLVASLNMLQMRFQLILLGESAFSSVQKQIKAAESARESSEGSVQFSGLSKGIHLEDVWFGYGEKPVLQGITAEIPTGAFVTIHGESGSGKTTLGDLIAGLYSPTRGRILLDGSPLGEIDIVSWRKAIGYVPQEMLLFSDSILNNVTLGDPGYTREDAEEALALADAIGFVRERPGGLEGSIGDRGGTLSGGQRQRIALARALIGKPALLILDEVTTALDPATEAAICATLRRLAGNVTILSISHQKAMQEVADHVFLMRDGVLEQVS